MTVNTVLFDAFGTLCDIRIKRRPFARLARFHPDRRRARELIMTRVLSLREAAHELQVQEVDLAMLDADLATESASICLYPEVPEVLGTLRRQGFRIGIVSNLAAPYAEPLLRLLPFEPDACAWSFEVGHLKPDPRIFAWICERLDVAPLEALMVGDTFADDYVGALASGLNIASGSTGRGSLQGCRDHPDAGRDSSRTPRSVGFRFHGPNGVGRVAVTKDRTTQLLEPPVGRARGRVIFLPERLHGGALFAGRGRGRIALREHVILFDFSACHRESITLSSVCIATSTLRRSDLEKTMRASHKAAPMTVARWISLRSIMAPAPITCRRMRPPTG
ncbi:MAG: HAD family hydrolase [Paraburkholderia sp.]|uniref:HAD family hydrolase n=1 Tax=Paraburkholderia sp. TaxID=1926495 RepID=UPI003C322E50